MSGKDYSQRGEQAVILEAVAHVALRNQPPRFLDIGANDGVTFSNTRALAERGWSGVHFEPNPRAAERLRSLYADDPAHVVHELAVADHEGQIQCWEFQDTLLTTSVRQHRDKWVDKAGKYTPLSVRCVRADKLDRLLPWPDKTVDVVNVDTEGTSLQVAMDLPFSRWRVAVAVVEFGAPAETWMFIHRMVRLHGMWLIHVTPENLIFRRPT